MTRKLDWPISAIAFAISGLAVASVLLTFPPFHPAEVGGNIDGCGGPCQTAGRTWDANGYVGAGFGALLAIGAFALLAYSMRKRSA